MKQTKYAGTQTEKNLLAAFAGESEARNKYTFFASKARKEGYEQIAALFLKTAENEKEHAKLWFKELEGIGDTIRVSLAAEPEKEVEAGFNILRAVGFPVTGPEVITCPTCGRTQYPCTEIANEVEKRLQGYKKSIKVAVMGCVVNGPGDAREADIGIAGGKGEAVLFIHGKPIKKLTGDNILDQFMDEIYKL